MNDEQAGEEGYVIASKTMVTLPGDDNVCQVLYQMPLPGVVILVHGVNSDGEWFEQTEQGLCRGLNRRLARCDEHLMYTGVEAGQMSPVVYGPELTGDGFVRDDYNSRNFITPAPHFSPVIRFRWGYKANDAELKRFGPNVLLNEHHYWGGGPFANGCSALPDLWTDGIDDRLFLWLTVQHFNPEKGRDIYACPPRAYYVHAAQRLARLIETIRSKQAGVPITVVCHSQGNMIGLAAAFLGQRQAAITDRRGQSAPPVADNYVLVNPPYSLREQGMGMDNWAQREVVNAAGQSGRQTGQARTQTLAAFFDILRRRAGQQQSDAAIDRRCANRQPADGSDGYCVQTDRQRYGSGHGRVTLYCNPHDQVISAATVQGIGWLGLSAAQIKATRADGVFTQRVWAQQYPVGQPGTYHYWHDHWRHRHSQANADGKSAVEFWHPPSKPARYNIEGGVQSRPNMIAALLTITTSPLMYLVSALARQPVHASPPGDWHIPVNAPALPHLFEPTARRFDREEGESAFDQGRDPNAALRNKHGQRAADDPYAAYAGSSEEAPQGDAQTEAQLRYEDRARLRMLARREGKADDKGNVVGEQPDATPSEEWVAWRRERITEFLKLSVDQNATDHSTIVCNAANAEKALAYDVAVGYSHLSPEDWEELRVLADWRLVRKLEAKGHPQAYLGEYFNKGTLSDMPLHQYPDYQPSAMPPEICDERQIAPQQPTGGS
ncbi:hypothetical protein SAMN06265795_101454 [Noviherbaspirillum humi]|uniref:T6SS Tle3 phospholipase effector alpha/beta domain-containing protein n=1 Tax=Noviherbaspirillum humi TaxID=1688639 RepID=A0A239CGJ9_9BURK|nr:hypothetical protein [Noviherbaspirillum humi]SNS19335.1 hypothetical protein SAMN06265795_101454 [Noviherbaspirillum humi]